jgi:hypothetical protein
MSLHAAFVIPSENAGPARTEGFRCEIFEVKQRDGKPGLANCVGCVAASTPPHSIRNDDKR